MKVSVSSYSFSQLLNSGLHTQFSVIGLAKELGFYGIEFTDLTPPKDISEEEFALMLKEEAKRVGIPIISYTVGADLTLDNAVEQLKHKVDIAKILGTDLLRHDIIYKLEEGETFEEKVKMLSDKCREVTEYAKSLGIRTCTENHGVVSQAPERVKALIDTTNDKNFGWLVDVGNFLCDACEPLASVKVALPYVMHAHVKDFVYSDEGFGVKNGKHIRGARIGKGVVPVLDCVKAIKESGYDGYLTIEYEGGEPVINALKESIEYLKEVL